MPRLFRPRSNATVDVEAPSPLRSSRSEVSLHTLVDSRSPSTSPPKKERSYFPRIPFAPSERSRLFGPISFGRKPSTSIYGTTAETEPLVDIEGDSEESNTSSTRFSWKGLRSQAKKRPLLLAGLQFIVLFVFSTLLLGGVLWLALPTLEEADRPRLRIPKSFEQLQDLNSLLKKYKTRYPLRVVLCFVTCYLFLQAFSVPGSMYLSILGGAVWGVPKALMLCCACVATGATLCYYISAALGPALLTMPKWKERLDQWALKIEEQRANLFSFLVVLRISPLPPHWVVNILAPHIGIRVPVFWVSTFFGIMGVTIIHTTIGGGLEEMTSAKDFKLLSWKNALLLGGIVLAVLIPVGLRYAFRGTIQSAEATELDAEALASADSGLPAGSSPNSPFIGSRPPTGRLILLDDNDELDTTYENGEPPLINLHGGSGSQRDVSLLENDDDELPAAEESRR